MDHPLEAWREAEGIPTKAAAAALLGMTSTQYCDIVSGRTEPSAARMRQIIDRTAGAVSGDDLVMWKAA